MAHTKMTKRELARARARSKLRAPVLNLLSRKFNFYRRDPDCYFYSSNGRTIIVNFERNSGVVHNKARGFKFSYNKESFLIALAHATLHQIEVADSLTFTKRDVPAQQHDDTTITILENVHGISAEALPSANFERIAKDNTASLESKIPPPWPKG